ncbi:MAG: fused MFS/spermidine synthase [Verrucomicrobiia bacterium]
MIRNARALFAAVTACFLASGAAGLIYQVVWSRYLALFLGHTSYAVVAVLVAFMGGLALGNALSGGWADRSAKPLALYAWLEFGIAVYALVFPGYYDLCHDGFVRLARSLEPGSTGLLVLKFLFSFLLVLPPAVLMGATFPVLTRFVTRSLAELRERVAALYAINSAGAVAGCLIADFWWIPRLGLELTTYGAAALNFAVGLVALVLSIRLEEEVVAPKPVASPAVAQVDERYSPGQLRLALVAIGVSGFVAMLYEVAWTRLLGLALGSSTHAFSLMLITFITGIAVGAWIIYLWKGLRRTLTAFAWAEIGLAFSLFVSMFFYQYLSFWFVRLAGLLARREEAYPIYEFLQASICFGVMLIPTICLGMTLPLVSRIATVELSRAGRSVGRVFAINTLGTVLGAVTTGLWLMPQIGLARTFAVGIALNAMIGVAALMWTRDSGRQWRPLLLPILVGAAIVWFVGAKLDPMWQRSLSLGLWRMGNPPRTLEEFRAAANAAEILFHRDGAGSTVDVLRFTNSTPPRLALKVNGKADAGTETDMITQLLFGHIPMLLRPQAKDALVIGLGSGMTCSAVARHSSIERVDAVEISPEVVEGAKQFVDFNDNILSNPKLHLSIEDAKSFLKTTTRKYDLIASEPSNPWMAGVAAVFTQEYYESCAERLQPDGLLTQWVQIYETTDETVELVLRTFLSVFPYASVWQPSLGDLILVGAQQPLRVDLEAMTRRFEELPVRQDLARVNLLTLPTVLARELIAQQNTLFVISPDGPVHSDYFPRLEYLAQRGFFLNRLAQGIRRFREDVSPRPSTLLGAYLQRHPLTADDFRACVRDYQANGIPEAAIFRSILLRWQGDSDVPAFPLDIWGAASDGIHVSEFQAARLAQYEDTLFRDAPSNPEPLRMYASDLMEAYRAQRSAFYVPPATNVQRALNRLIETDPSQVRISRLRLAEIAWDHGDDARCIELGEAAFDPDVSKAGPVDFSKDAEAPYAVLYRMAESFWRRGQVKEAWAVCQQAKVGGYVERSRSVFPVLEVTYRRVESAVSQGALPTP